MAHLLHLALVMRIPLSLVWVLCVSMLGCGAENVTMDSPADANNDTSAPDAATDAAAAPGVTRDNCLDGADLNSATVDISNCPPLPSYPEVVLLGDTGVEVRLGAWEIGQTADGDVYKFGSLSGTASPGQSRLTFDGGSTEVNAENLSCWAKGYYRLRKLLQDPPANYISLRNAGFQFRFFQFQSDLRNGPTGYREISSYQDHLVKWVTVVGADGVCDEPTLQDFEDYVAAELNRRGL